MDDTTYLNEIEERMIKREKVIDRLERRRLETVEDLVAKQQLKERINRMDLSVDKLRLKVSKL